MHVVNFKGFLFLFLSFIKKTFFLLWTYNIYIIRFLIPLWKINNFQCLYNEF